MPNDTTQLDPAVVALMHGLKMQEGTNGNYSGMGDKDASGNFTSAGIGQWSNQMNGVPTPLKQGGIPSDFQEQAKALGMNPNDFSPENQNRVMYGQLSADKKAGLQPEQILSKWNSGDPNKYLNAATSTGSGTVGRYDVASYVKGAMNYAQQYAQAHKSNASAASPTDQSQQPFEGISGQDFAATTAQGVENFKNQNESDYQDSLVQGALVPWKTTGTNPNPIKEIGAGAANTLSDIWGIAKGLFSVATQPDKFVAEVIKDPTLLAGPAAQQLLNGAMATMQTGDFSNIWKGLQRAGVAAINHPLLSIAPFMASAGEAAKVGESGNLVSKGGADVGSYGKAAPSGIAGTISELVKNPLGSTFNALKGAAGSVAGAITGGIDTIMGRGQAPGTYLANQILTSGKLQDMTNKSVTALNTQISQLTQQHEGLGTSISQLADLVNKSKEAITTPGEAPTPIEITPRLQELQLEQEKLSTQIDALNTLKENILQQHLKTTENLKSISSMSDTPEQTATQIYHSLGTLTDKVRAGYEALTPGTSFPTLDPIIEGLTNFRDELKQGANTALAAKVDKMISDFKAKQIVQPLAQQTGGDLSQLSKSDLDEAKLFKKGNTVYDNNGQPVTPASSSFIKTTLGKELYEQLSGNTSYGKMYMTHIKPALDEALTSGMSAADRARYESLNPIFSRLTSSGIVEDMRNAVKNSTATNLFKNPDVRETLGSIHPGLLDWTKQSIMKSILSNAFDIETKTFDPVKLIEQLQENKKFLNSEDYQSGMSAAQDLLKHQQDTEAMQAQMKAATTDQKTVQKAQNVEQKNIDTFNKTKASDYAKQQKDYQRQYNTVEKQVGATPEEAFQKIGGLGSVEDAQALAKTAGVTPSDLGKMWVRRAVESVDPNYMDGSRSTVDLNKVNTIDKMLQDAWKGTPELRQMMLGPDGVKAIDTFHYNAQLLQNLLKGEGHLSATGRIARVVGGTVLLPLIPFGKLTALKFIKEGIMGGEKVSSVIPEDINATVQPKQGIIGRTVKGAKKGLLSKPVVQTGVAAANAESGIEQEANQ